MKSSNQKSFEETVAFENLIVFRDKLISSMVENVESSELEKTWDVKKTPQKATHKIIRNFTLQLKEHFRKRFQVFLSGKI